MNVHYATDFVKYQYNKYLVNLLKLIPSGKMESVKSSLNNTKAVTKYLTTGVVVPQYFLLSLGFVLDFNHIVIELGCGMWAHFFN